MSFVNASWYMPGGAIDAKQQHKENRLTEATAYFSIAEIADTNSGLPNTMPSLECWKEHMQRLRIN